MKVYVTTKAEPFKDEMFIGVFSTYEKAKKQLKKDYPYMRESTPSPDISGAFISDKNSNYLLFIREEEVI